MSAAFRWISIAVIVAAVTGGYLALRRADPAEELRAASVRWQSSSQCRDCHRDVWDEWHGSHHQIAYENPEVRDLSDGFRNKACAACHLPQPVAKTGFGQRVLPRTARPDEGVGCIACHLGASGEILGVREVASAPCKPVRREGFASVDMCASCHNQHWTTDQWSASPWAQAAVACSDCHMPDVERRAASGATRIGRGHAFLGSHDLETLRSAVMFDVAVDGGQLVVTTTNTGAGHNFPTEERSRAADIRYRFLDPERRPIGGGWTDAYRFRLPYRDEPLPDTQLGSGATEVVRIDVPDGAAGADVRLWYRTQPYVGDDHAASRVLFERAVAWTAEELARHDPDADRATRADHAAVLAVGLERQRELAARRRARTPAVAPAVAAAAAPVDVPTGLGLRPLLAEFEAMAASAPEPPPEERMAELIDLLVTAHGSGGALPRVRKMSERTLAEQEDAVWAFERGLSNEDALVRSQSAFELGRRGHRPAIPLLLLRLKDEQDPIVLAWVADALALLGNYAGLDSLAQLMDRADAAETAGARAIRILKAAGKDPGEAPTWDDLKQGLAELHAAWREQGFTAGADGLDPTTAARLAAHFTRLEGFDLRPVDEARFVLARMGRAVLPLLRRALQARETYLRDHALQIVRDLGPLAAGLADVVTPLLSEPISAALAAETLGAIGARAAQRELLALIDDDDIDVAAAAAEALGKVGDPAAVGPLRNAFADEARPIDVRVRIAFSLALLDPSGGGRAFLIERKTRGDYHEPTIDELLRQLDEPRGR